MERPTDTTSARFFNTKRKPKGIGEAWAIVGEELPDGWVLIEVSYLHGPEAPEPSWYAAAGQIGQRDGEFIDAEGDDPVGALLRLAGALHRRRHRIGRPSKEHLPPPLPRRPVTTDPYRSPDIGTVARPVF